MTQPTLKEDKVLRLQSHQVHPTVLR